MVNLEKIQYGGESMFKRINPVVKLMVFVVMYSVICTVLTRVNLDLNNMGQGLIYGFMIGISVGILHESSLKDRFPKNEVQNNT